MLSPMYDHRVSGLGNAYVVISIPGTIRTLVCGRVLDSPIRYACRK